MKIKSLPKLRGNALILKSLLVPFILTALTQPASAVESTTINGIRYDVISFESKTAKLSNDNDVTGEITIQDEVDIPRQVWNEDLKKYETVYVTCKVIEISPSAFSSNTKITKVIGNTIKTIGSSAFRGCTALKKVAVGNGLVDIENSAFSGCTALETVNIPEGIKKIGDSAFNRCTALYAGGTLTIPASLSTMGQSAFRQSGIKELVFAVKGGKTSLETISDNAFASCPNLCTVTLAKGITTIGKYAFSKCEKLGSGNNIILEFPASVQLIDMFAFRECENLEMISFKEGLDSISGGAFYKTALKSLLFPKTLRAIGCWPDDYKAHNKDFYSKVIQMGGAFQECKSLETVKFQENMEKDKGFKRIHVNSFKNCDKIARIDFPYTTDEKRGLQESAFENCSNLKIVTEANSKCLSTHKTTFKQSGVGGTGIQKRVNDWLDDENKIVEKKKSVRMASVDASTPGRVIGEQSFYLCSNMTGLPDNIVSFGAGAFSYCHSLVDVYFPDAMTEVPDRAFHAANSLQAIMLPHTVTRIGQQAFDCCYKLTDINIPNRVKAIEKQTFSACFELKSITLPMGVRSIDYQAFYADSNLENFRLPDSLRTIGEEAFGGCRSFSGVLIIPDSVTHIGRGAFSDCNYIEGLELGSAGLLRRPLVKPLEIGVFAFDGINLQTITSYHTIPPVLLMEEYTYADNETVVRYPFKDLVFETAVLTVPAGRAAAYREAEGWKLFKNIVEMGSSGVVDPEADSAEFTLTVGAAGALTVDGVDADVPVRVHTTDGRVVFSGTGCATIEGLQPGLYVVSVGATARKVRI